VGKGLVSPALGIKIYTWIQAHVHVDNPSYAINVAIKAVYF
jgi:hypothetical protein